MDEELSLYLDFFSCAFQLLSELPSFFDSGDDLEEIDEHFVDPIPRTLSLLGASNVENIMTNSYIDFVRQINMFTEPSEHYTISAVTTAITFLRTLPLETHKDL